MREIKFRAWDGKNMIMNPLNFGQNFPRNEWMQFTGLKDKNSEEIYERDIVRGNPVGWTGIGSGPVIYENGAFLVRIGEGMGDKLLHNGFFGKVEIIGNVYEMELVVEQDGARGINPIQHAREAVGLAGGNKMLRRYIGNVLKQKED